MKYIKNLRKWDFLIPLPIVFLLVLFFGYKKYSYFDIVFFTLTNSIAFGLFTNKGLIIEKFRCGHINWIEATRANNLVSAFLVVPIIYSFFLATFSFIFKQNIFLLIPEKVFNNIISINYIELLRAIFYLWFKQLITAQAIIVSLIGLEILRYKRENRSNELQKYEDYYTKYHSKSVSSKKKIMKKFYEIRSYKIIWFQWFSVSLLYLIFIFSFKNNVFN